MRKEKTMLPWTECEEVMTREQRYREQAQQAAPKLQAPSIEQLMQWEQEGGCEAACEYGCWVEPDGRCEHGKWSWLRALGMI